MLKKFLNKEYEYETKHSLYYLSGRDAILLGGYFGLLAFLIMIIILI